MKNPYLVLDLWQMKETLSDEQVKKAYLQLVQQYTTDRYPERFQQIQAAYEQLQTHKKRLQHDLFDTTLADRDDLVVALLPKSELRRPDLQTLQNILMERK